VTSVYRERLKWSVMTMSMSASHCPIATWNNDVAYQLLGKVRYEMLASDCLTLTWTMILCAT